MGKLCTHSHFQYKGEWDDLSSSLNMGLPYMDSFPCAGCLNSVPVFSLGMCQLPIIEAGMREEQDCTRAGVKTLVSYDQAELWLYSHDEGAPSPWDSRVCLLHTETCFTLMTPGFYYTRELVKDPSHPFVNVKIKRLSYSSGADYTAWPQRRQENPGKSLSRPYL